MDALSGEMLIRMVDAYEVRSGVAGDAADADREIDVAARMKADPDVVYKALFRHYRPTKPIVAAVEGVVIAGGTEMLQAMEIRVAGESARFGVCANGTLAVEAITRTLHECDGMELDEALRHEWEYGQAVFRSEDAREGPRAFAEKRKPVFKRQ
jgi:enoyl-CoA hydratase/carnithine racemase